MIFGLGTTIAAIAIGQAVVRVPTKLDGWMEDVDLKHMIVEEYEPPTEADGRLALQASPPTASKGYATATVAMSRVDLLRAEIESYKELTEGWDGEGSVTPSNAAIDGARKLIDRLPAGITLPKAMISSSGELGFYWKTDTFYADIAIEDANIFSLFVRSRVNPDREFYFPALPIDETGAASIRDTLQQV
jgi:hypothetical protein